MISRSFIKIFLIAEFRYTIILTRKNPVRGLLLWKQKSLQKSSATMDHCNAALWTTGTRFCNIVQIYCFILNLSFLFDYVIHNASWDEHFMPSENFCNFPDFTFVFFKSEFVMIHITAGCFDFLIWELYEIFMEKWMGKVLEWKSSVGTVALCRAAFRETAIEKLWKLISATEYK